MIGFFVAELVGLLIALALFIVSTTVSILLRPRFRRPNLRNNDPTELTDRGAFIPLGVGRKLLSPVFSWAGKRTQTGGTNNVFFEEGWHMLAVGPAARLHRITQDGKVIWQGPADPTTHPSGSNIAASPEGNFDIYWGEINQPVNLELGDVSRLGTTSRWPFGFYIHWRKKRLGPIPRWPVLEYEVEVRNFDSGLVASPSWFPATLELQPEQSQIVAMTAGLAGTAKITILGIKTNIYIPGKYFKVSGNGQVDGTHRVISSVQKNIVLTIPPFPPTPTWVTEMIVEDEISTAFVGGYTQVYNEALDDGANHAHVLWQFLFSPHPHGLGQDPSLYDISSLEALGQLCQAEGLRASVWAQNGEQADALVESILRELGCKLPMVEGKLRFVPMRDPGDPTLLPKITADLIQPQIPESGVELEDKIATRLLFTFTDRARNFRLNQVPIDDDGEADRIQQQKPTLIELSTVIDLQSASAIAERRSQEIIGGTLGVKKIVASRGARLLFPGRPFTIEDSPGVFRAESVTPDTYSGKVTIEAINDFYGAPISSYSLDQGGPPPPATNEVEADLAITIVEVPVYKLPSGVTQQILVPRIRSAINVSGGLISISPDGGVVNYEIGVDSAIVAGGKLLEELVATTLSRIEQGPIVVAYGPDMPSGVLNLSTDLNGWAAGRQWCVIDDEICFVREVEALGNSQYRLRGLIRARYDTDKASHAIQAAVYIFRFDDLLKIEHAALTPGASILARSKPVPSNVLLLTDFTKALLGKGVAPPKPANLNTQNNSLMWLAGAAIALKWNYRSPIVPKTGAGLQGAGFATSVSPVLGEFVLRFFTTGGVLKRTVTGITATTYTYPNATLVSDFGGEPTAIKAQLSNVSSGYSSPLIEVTISRI